MACWWAYIELEKHRKLLHAGMSYFQDSANTGITERLHAISSSILKSYYLLSDDIKA